MKTKSVEFAYPSSPDAVRFGFAKLGCYVVELSNSVQTVALAGYYLRRDAMAHAEELPEDWSSNFVKTDYPPPNPMNEEELKIEAGCTHEKGGQTVGEISTRVKVTHLPTGLVAVCDQGRSQFRSKTIAVSMIEWGLSELNYNASRNSPMVIPSQPTP